MLDLDDPSAGEDLVFIVAPATAVRVAEERARLP
jgi:hypothetical protein